MTIDWTLDRKRVAHRLIAEYNITPHDIEDAAAYIDAKCAEAVSRIVNAPFDLSSTYCGHSGGKDSILVRYLADLAGNVNVTIHTSKPEGVRNAVHPLTRDFLYGQPRPILYVPEGHMQQILQQTGLTTQIDGTRKSEADRRDGRDVGLVVNGENRSRSEIECYMSNGLFGLNFVYPIYDWTDAEVWAAIFVHNIPFSAEYQ